MSVYAAELQGILLALEILESQPRLQRQKAIIFSDNQSALKTLHNPGNSSAQFILVKILQAWDTLTPHGVRVTFRWIPAHRDVPGGDAADRAAKQATADPDHAEATADREETQELPTLLTTARRAVNSRIQDDWSFVWDKAKQGRHLHSLGRKPDKKDLTLHRNLPRPISSIITQM